MPHSDHLAWLSSATLKIFISGVSSRIWYCKKQIWSTFRVDWDGILKIEDDLKNEDDLKDEDHLKN